MRTRQWALGATAHLVQGTYNALEVKRHSIVDKEGSSLLDNGVGSECMERGMKQETGVRQLGATWGQEVMESKPHKKESRRRGLGGVDGHSIRYFAWHTHIRMRNLLFFLIIIPCILLRSRSKTLALDSSSTSTAVR